MYLVAYSGLAAIIHGGIDDSPGLQMIGLIVVLTSLITAARRGFRSRQRRVQ